MSEKTKPEAEKQERKETEQSEPEEDTPAWGSGQQEKSYYYDDAHGYEIYNPDEDEDEE